MKKATQPEAFPPGEFIRDELEARGWTQADLAAIMGRPLRTLNEIITAKKSITPQTAIGLAKALGTSAELWLNLEGAYRLSLVKNGVQAIARQPRIFDQRGKATSPKKARHYANRNAQPRRTTDRRRLEDFEIALNHCLNLAETVASKRMTKVIQLLRDARSQAQQLHG